MTSAGPNVHQLQIRRILKKLDEVRTRKLTCFGCESHQFQLQPPLSEEEVQRFESSHGIELPSCYRAFLLQAGHGGAGPYYGLYTLDKWDAFATWVLDDVPQGFLKAPSSGVVGTNPEMDADDPHATRQAYQGTLTLGTQGCTYVMQLIVTGPLRGRVMYGDAEGRPPFVVRDRDFLAWYERWLDELLGGYDISWFGFSPPGGEKELLESMAPDQADPGLRSEAAAALVRLPRLSDEGVRRVTEHLQDPLGEVREGACHALGKHAPDAGIEPVVELLADPSPDVRQAAARTLMARGPQRWGDRVRQRMREESDENAAHSMFYALSDAGQIHKAELMDIIQATPLDRLRASAVYKLDWKALTDEHHDFVTRLLNDSHPQVRLHAGLGLRGTTLKLPVATISACLERESDPTTIEHLLNYLEKQADPEATDALLKWTRCGDDFHELTAIKGLLRIGDERVVPRVKEMLQETRSPERQTSSGSISNTRSIESLVREALRDAPQDFLARMGLQEAANRTLDTGGSPVLQIIGSLCSRK